MSTKEQDVITLGRVSDTITQKAVRFYIDETLWPKWRKAVPFVAKSVCRKRKFLINPPSYGKMQQIAKLCLNLNLDETAFSASPINECMRLCSEHTDDITRLLAMATMENEEDVTDDDKVEKCAAFFRWNAGVNDLTKVVMIIFTLNDFRSFIGSIRCVVIILCYKVIYSAFLRFQ